MGSPRETSGADAIEAERPRRAGMPDLAAARRVARRLRERLLALPTGELLGSEPDLMAEVGIDRDTLRRAMRTLESEGLVRLRRGQRPGYVACRPDEATVVSSAAMFLRSRQATILDAMAVISPLLVDAARRAAACEDEALRSQLREIVEDLALFSPARDSPAQLLRSSTDFMNCLLTMAANPVLELYVRCATRLGLIEASADMASDAELMAVRHRSVLLIGEALLRGDADMAALLQEQQLGALAAAMREYHRQRARE